MATRRDMFDEQDPFGYDQPDQSFDPSIYYEPQPSPSYEPPPPPVPDPPFLAGGTFDVPPTAENVEPQQIAPSIFTTQPVGPVGPGPGFVAGDEQPQPAPTPKPAASASDIFNLADESGFNGVTYAGFSPGSHQGANLMDPMNAKYALQQYLVNSGANLGGSAPQIAAALNARYGAAYGNPNFFVATDGETIMMPDGQYVHAAPNGYAMASGTFNPGNAREVFWGATGSPYSGSGDPWAGTPSAGGGSATAPKATAKTAGAGATGASLSSTDLSKLIGQLQSMFPSNPVGASGPVINGPGVGLTDGLNQIGQTPFDDLMSQSLSDLLTNHGQTPFGQSIEATLSDIISRGGITPDITKRLVAARDDEAGAFAGQLADARNALASRGLASVPGSPQGPEDLAVSRISENLAPPYASAVARIESDAMDLGNKSLMDSLQMATGMSANDTNNILNAIGTGTARQTALANIALRTLEDNMDWNKFLAQFGLDRDRVAEELAQGRITALVPLLQMFLQLAGQSAQGFIGQ